jgi:hypothetical protein
MVLARFPVAQPFNRYVPVTRARTRQASGRCFTVRLHDNHASPKSSKS